MPQNNYLYYDYPQSCQQMAKQILLPTDLSNHLRRKRCALIIGGEKPLMSAQLLLELIIHWTKVPPGVAHFLSVS